MATSRIENTHIANSTMTTETQSLVANVLQTSAEYLDIGQIARSAKIGEDAVKGALKSLATEGQIDVILGSARRPARYGWLASAKPIIEAAPAPKQAVETGPSAYLVRVPKRKPRIMHNYARAIDAALSAARNGAGRAEVFELIPVGTARRGAEWVTCE